MTVLKGHVSQLVSARSTASASLSGLQNVVMQLRKVCNHPYLFPGAEPEPFAVREIFDPRLLPAVTRGCPCLPQEGDHIFQNCGKMWVLDR